MKITKNIKFATVGVGILAAILTIGCFLHDGENAWQKVEYQKVKETFTVSGNIETLQKSILRAPLVGEIISVYVEEGDKVKAGQLLAQFKKDLYIAQIDSRKADLYQAQQNYNKMLSGYRPQEVKKAKADYDAQKQLLEQKKLEYEKVKTNEVRYKELYNKEMLTPQFYEEYLKDLAITKTNYENQLNAITAAENNYSLMKEGFRSEDIKAAKGMVESMKADIERIETIYEKTDIIAEIPGTITMKAINIGDNVQLGDPLFDIYNNYNLQVKALIEEEDIRNIKLNDEVKIVMDAHPNKTITGTIIAIYDKVDTSTRLLPVKLVIKENKDKIKLLPGMTASCTFGGHEINYLTVPKTSLQKDGKKYYVKTKHGNVYLEVGQEHGDRVLVKGDLKPGDEVYSK